MNPVSLVFATGNKHKVEEVLQIVGDKFSIQPMSALGITDEPEETEDNLKDNAILKARHLYGIINTNCFAEDTGLEVDALEGAPGVYSARYAGSGKRSSDNIALLLQNLSGIGDRRARFRTVLALIYNNELYTFEGTVEGVITTYITGQGGFGYDPVFLPDGYDKTFAELDPSVKNAISHRFNAVTKMVEWFNDRL